MADIDILISALDLLPVSGEQTCQTHRKGNQTGKQRKGWSGKRWRSDTERPCDLEDSGPGRMNENNVS
jgi:hypothetical protein